MISATHKLRDRWFVSFLPVLKLDVINKEYNGNWTLAARHHRERLDWVTTVEELWSTINSLPRIHLLGTGSAYIFSRDDKEPKFEAFPNGSRVIVNLLSSSSADTGLDLLLSIVLGEQFNESIESSETVCDIVRIVARSTREHSEVTRIEIWLNNKAFLHDLKLFIIKLFNDSDLDPSLYTIGENIFDT